MLCSTLGALAGILESVRIDTIQALQGGFPLMFYAVAAAVIGGTSLFGGSGTIIGAALGVLVLAVLNLGFTIQGISAYWFDFVLGLAIIVSMALNVTLERIRQSGRLGGSDVSESATRRPSRRPCSARRDPGREHQQELRRRDGARGRLAPRPRRVRCSG